MSFSYRSYFSDIMLCFSLLTKDGQMVMETALSNIKLIRQKKPVNVDGVITNFADG